jgi:hypothetical protein
MVYLLVKIGQPADVVLGPVDLQFREPVENAGYNQLAGFDGS